MTQIERRHKIKNRDKEILGRCTPDMGVILWGASPLYLVSVSSLQAFYQNVKFIRG